MTTIFQQYSTNRLNYLRHCYLTRLSYKDQIQAQHQTYIASSIGILIQ